MGRLFGTDGARGIANKDLTPELVMNIGRAAAMALCHVGEKKPVFIIGRDTRQSGDMIEGALVAGLCSVGADVKLAGVVPTPAVAYLVTKHGASAGIMISASHNPFEFNGIKLFDKNGFKLPDAIEEDIEAIVLDGKEEYPQNIGGDLGSKEFLKTAADEYIEYVKSTAPVMLDGLEIAFDCSNGSASRTAGKLFSMLGVKCHMLHNNPDGVNINDKCGSTHMDDLAAYVKEHNLTAGIAFDGDADRCLAVDEDGEIIDGDFIMAMCGKDLKDRGDLKKNAIVGTVMSNMGFQVFCRENGIELIQTKVGDRYVLEEMQKHGYCIGGEQSGHVIFLEHSTTGDGQMTAVQLLSYIKKEGKSLKELSKIIKKYPQVLVNVTVTPEGKEKYASDKPIEEAIKKGETELDNTGRILVRLSGTEPLIRVMAEGEDLEQITRITNSIAGLVKQRLS